ncbi:hypothetical protein B4087_4998 [Bacillus cereus]|nr:hypothetical protein B4087_4998 [Bacillus cereus]
MFGDLEEKMILAFYEPDEDKEREMVQEIMNSPEMEEFNNMMKQFWECTVKVVKNLLDHIREIVRVVKRYQRINSYRKQRIKHRRRVSNMSNHKKKKLKKRLARRAKDFDKSRTNKAWRNIFVKAGIVN